MANIYIIQLIGVLLVAAGLAALIASAYVLGRPPTRDEQSRTDSNSSHRLPINLQTAASTAFVLSGMGILTWSKFDICVYLAYWLPGMSESIRFWLSCR